MKQTHEEDLEDEYYEEDLDDGYYEQDKGFDLGLASSEDIEDGLMDFFGF